MARIRIVTPKNAGKAAEKQFFNFIRRADAALDEIGKDYIRDIRDKAENPKTGRRYRALKQSTIEQRKRIARNNPTSNRFSPKKPNLTITGQFLDSFRGNVARRGKFSRTLVIEPTGIHKGYRNLNGTRRPSVANSVIAERMESLGRNVLSISKRRANEIVERFRVLLRRSL